MPATSNYEVIGHLLTLLRKKQPFTRYDAARILNMHDRTALRFCQALVEAGLLRGAKKGRATYYSVTHVLTPAAKAPRKVGPLHVSD